MQFFGIKLVGINAENGHKLILTVGFILSILFLKFLIAKGLNYLYRRHEKRFIRFWSRQILNMASAFIILLTFLSIWFDDPTRLATGLGLVTAGLAFALQKVVTSLAGYFIIMRGNTFSVGERITMGGIRGDVVALGFLQTTIMEMGQPPSVQGADPAMWIKGRQFTGRIVTVTNDKIFENPVYNYTRELPFIWEEINLPIKYSADRKVVERILTTSVMKHVEKVEELSQPLLRNLEQKYDIRLHDMVPKIFYRLTDNWLEMSVRFMVPERGVRDIKSAISLEIIEALDREQIELASATFELVGMPPLDLRVNPRSFQKNSQENQPLS
jgi:small-conductance mechanosensitive channel